MAPVQILASTPLASNADVLRGSSRVTAPLTDVSGAGTRDEPLRTSAGDLLVLSLAARGFSQGTPVSLKTINSIIPIRSGSHGHVLTSSY